MEGVLRVENGGKVKIGSHDNLVLRDGLLSNISNLNEKLVRVTSFIKNEYKGKDVIVVLGLEEVDDVNEPSTKRLKPEPQSSLDNLSSSNVPIAELTRDQCLCFQGKVTNKSEIRRFKSGKGELITIEIEDSSGKIRCTAFNSACGRVEAIVKIGNYYRIEDGTLKESNKQYNNTGHDFEFTISDRTRIEEIEGRDEYTEIGEMFPGHVYTTKGIVLLCGDLIEYKRDDRVNKRRTIVIADGNESCIEITVFGNSMPFDIGSYVKISMLRVGTWQEKTTGTVSNANAISCIYTPDSNTSWFVEMYDNNRNRYEELVQPWTGKPGVVRQG